MTTPVRRSAELHPMARKNQLIPELACSHRATDRTSIMQLAALIEQSAERRLQWFTDDPIDSLGGRTAAELVALNRGHQVKMFLHQIIYSDGQRLPIY